MASRAGRQREGEKGCSTMSSDNISPGKNAAESPEAEQVGAETAAATTAADQPEPAAARPEAAADQPQSEGAPEGSVSSEVSEEEDRRRAYRLNKVLGATLTSTSGDSKAARLFVIDISASGFRATDHQPHTEEQYDISVVLDKGKEPFRSRMRVVWTKELTVSGMFQMGCEFIDPDPDEVEKLTAFIEAERKKSEPVQTPVNLGRPWTMIR
jgi:hypothetical protein